MPEEVSEYTQGMNIGIYFSLKAPTTQDKWTEHPAGQKNVYKWFHLDIIIETVIVYLHNFEAEII